MLSILIIFTVYHSGVPLPFSTDCPIPPNTNGSNSACVNVESQAAAPATSRGVNGTRQGCSKAKGEIAQGIWEVLYAIIYIYIVIYIMVVYFVYEIVQKNVVN